MPTLRFPFKDYAERLRSVNGFFEAQIRASVARTTSSLFDARWLERCINTLGETTFDPLAPSDGISAALLEMRRTTSLVATFSTEYSRQIAELSKGKRGGISSLLQYWKTSHAYKKDIKSLHRRTEELYKLLEKEYAAQRPEEPSIDDVLQRLKEIEKAIPKREETKKQDEPKPQKGAEQKEETPPAPVPPPKPPHKPEDPDLSQKKQEKAAKIIGQFNQSLATIVVNVNINCLNVNFLPGAASDGKSTVQIASDALAGRKAQMAGLVRKRTIRRFRIRSTTA